MANNNTKSTQFGLVIEPLKENANPEQELANLQSELLKHFNFVATIIHYKDKEQNEQLKRTHAHAYIETLEKYTKNQMLKKLSDLLKIDTLRLSLDITNNEYLLCQYLTHKNDQNKTQYDISEVLTNNKELYNYKYNLKYIDSEAKKRQLDFDLKDAKTLTEFINRQGLETANKFRNTFNQVKQEQKQDYETLLEEHNKLADFVENIKNYIKDYDFINDQDQVLKSYIKRLIERYKL